MKRFVHFIDSICKWAARIVLGLPIAMMVLGSYEVVMRNVFNSPTRWVWALNGQLLCIFVGLAGAYTLLADGHVRMDLFYSRFSGRTRAIVNSVLSLIFFALASGLIYHLGKIGLDSVAIRQVDPYSTWGAPIYPAKMLLALSAVLMLLAGITNFIRNINTAITGKESTL